VCASCRRQTEELPGHLEVAGVPLVGDVPAQRAELASLLRRGRQQIIVKSHTERAAYAEYAPTRTPYPAPCGPHAGAGLDDGIEKAEAKQEAAPRDGLHAVIEECRRDVVEGAHEVNAKPARWLVGQLDARLQASEHHGGSRVCACVRANVSD